MSFSGSTNVQRPFNGRSTGVDLDMSNINDLAAVVLPAGKRSDFFTPESLCAALGLRPVHYCSGHARYLKSTQRFPSVAELRAMSSASGRFRCRTKYGRVGYP